MYQRKSTMPWHDEARELEAHGKTYAEIACAVGVSETTVRRFLDYQAYRDWLDNLNAKRKIRYQDDPAYREAQRERSLVAVRARRAASGQLTARD